MDECKKEKSGRDLNAVYCDNWLNSGLPDKCAKLMICDPPYYKVRGEFDFIFGPRSWRVALDRPKRSHSGPNLMT